ncbi:uncharacterized protein [Hyperolius riggenbachi]|uniref:uncharacterized protein n=1 Tax=Hyperolius riggenbachi TaxID=752182 RepID=UPI0035A3A3BD
MQRSRGYSAEATRSCDRGSRSGVGPPEPPNTMACQDSVGGTGHARSPPQRCQQDLLGYIRDLPTKDDFKKIFPEVKMDIKEESKETLSESDQSENVDRHAEVPHTDTSPLQNKVRSLTLALRDLEYRVEGLDDRQRENCLLIRGIPESVTDHSLPRTLQGLFTVILARLFNEVMGLEEVFRLSKPRRTTEPARDVVCRFHHYTTKQEILQKSRSLGDVLFDTSRVKILPFISKATLLRRRALKPLLCALQKEGIRYTWGIPFKLVAFKGDRCAVLRFPEDLQKFFKILNIPPVQVPNWDTLPNLVHSTIYPAGVHKDRDGFKEECQSSVSSATLSSSSSSLED